MERIRARLGVNLNPAPRVGRRIVLRRKKIRCGYNSRDRSLGRQRARVLKPIHRDPRRSRRTPVRRRKNLQFPLKIIGVIGQLLNVLLVKSVRADPLIGVEACPLVVANFNAGLNARNSQMEIQMRCRSRSQLDSRLARCKPGRGRRHPARTNPHTLQHIVPGRVRGRCRAALKSDRRPGNGRARRIEHHSLHRCGAGAELLLCGSNAGQQNHQHQFDNPLFVTHTSRLVETILGEDQEPGQCGMSATAYDKRHAMRRSVQSIKHTHRLTTRFRESQTQK